MGRTHDMPVRLHVVFLCLLAALAAWIGLSPDCVRAQEADRPESPYMIEEGELPGVTWADDIHPIFRRNLCKNCHIRGNTLYVDKLEKFALGLIDPRDSANPYYSYHELVYAEGPPLMMKDEPLRDGQCCWPYKYPMRKQRRIWIGHSERSALMHKVERDYYDWERPPRFVEEGLRMRWGLPMPWADPDKADSGLNEPIKVRGPIQQAILYARLFLDMGPGEKIELPPRIPARDRALIRYWIDNAMQVEKEGTLIRARVVDGRGRAVRGASVEFVGNYNSAEMREVRDRFSMEASEEGTVEASFPVSSVITKFWFLRATKDGREGAYEVVAVTDGALVEVLLTLPDR